MVVADYFTDAISKLLRYSVERARTFATVSDLLSKDKIDVGTLTCRLITSKNPLPLLFDIVRVPISLNPTRGRQRQGIEILGVFQIRINSDLVIPSRLCHPNDSLLRRDVPTSQAEQLGDLSDYRARRRPLFGREGVVELAKSLLYLCLFAVADDVMESKSKRLPFLVNRAPTFVMVNDVPREKIELRWGNLPAPWPCSRSASPLPKPLNPRKDICSALDTISEVVCGMGWGGKR